MPGDAREQRVLHPQWNKQRRGFGNQGFR